MSKAERSRSLPTRRRWRFGERGGLRTRATLESLESLEVAGLVETVGRCWRLLPAATEPGTLERLEAAGVWSAERYDAVAVLRALSAADSGPGPSGRVLGPEPVALEAVERVLDGDMDAAVLALASVGEAEPYGDGWRYRVAYLPAGVGAAAITGAVFRRAADLEAEQAELDHAEAVLGWL